MSSLVSLIRRRTRHQGLPERGSIGSMAIRELILDRGLNPERALALGDALEAEGKLVEAVEALQLANRLRRSPVIERRLPRLRRAAFAAINHSPGPRAWPPVALEADGSASTPADRNADQGPTEALDELTFNSPGPSVITAAQLTPARLWSGILHDGSILVRGLVGAERVQRLTNLINRAFAAYDAHAAGAPIARTTPWFDPLDDVPDADVLRNFARNHGGILTGDSPRALFEFLETLADLGLDRMITAYLGERPALSLQKCTLRRAEPSQTGNAWHQDGSFIGHDIRSINVWLSLSHCGRNAPGLDIIPTRIGRVLPVGTAGALYAWDVSPHVVREAFPHGSFWRPDFEPGDALFFDHLCVHRTGVDAVTMTEQRFAIESWFFAPSVYPQTQTPLLV